MKKLLCMILALVMMLSLCACGQETPNTDTNGNANNDVIQNGDNTTQDTEPTQETTLPAEPTEEEKELLKEYVNTVASLSSNSANSAAQRTYNQLMAMDLDTVSLWASTQWAEWAYNQCDKPENFHFPADFNCAEVLSRFTKVENVLLSYSVTETDIMGNVDGPRVWGEWFYNPDGQVVSAKNEFSTRRINIDNYATANSVFDLTKYSNQREYDAVGQLSKISYSSSSGVVVTRTFTYDEAGKLITQVAKAYNSENVYNYSYDEAGRLVKIERSYVNLYKYLMEDLYFYDDNGNLVKEEFTIYETSRSRGTNITYRNIMEYAYDDANTLVSGTHTTQEWDHSSKLGNYLRLQKVTQFTYVLDDEGRVVKEIGIPGDTINMQTNKVDYTTKTAEIVYETTYGDFYIYTPAV